MIVRKVDGVWVPFTGVNEPFKKTVAVCDIHYHDGRVERDQPCKPYPVEVLLSNNDALNLYSDDDLAAYGLKRAVAFETPDGKRTVGDARYVEARGVVREEYDVEDTPSPPTTAQKFDRLLVLAGMTKAEFKEAAASLVTTPADVEETKAR